MNKRILSFANAALLFAAVISGAAQEVDKANLHRYFAVKPHPNATPEQMVKEAAQGTGLTVWNYSTKSSRNGTTYNGAMVGADPSTSNATTNITAQVVPIIFTISGTRFDPTKPDNTCEAGKVPATLFMQSPIIKKASFTLNGVNVGKGQYLDDFQRANFWDEVQAAGGKYHTNLKVKKLKAITVDPGSHGQIVFTGGCEPLGGVDINWWDSYVTGTILPSLASKGVGPTTFPMLLMYDVIMYVGSPNSCCILGYHGAIGNPMQTYSPFEFDSTGAFDNGDGFTDSYVAAHEVGEWMNDPSGRNPTPAWGHVGQVSGCQNNLEVGDPLTGTGAVTKTMSNGFTYHLQELAYFSWFYGAPSIGAGGIFSDNGTFTSDAGSVCH